MRRYLGGVAVCLFAVWLTARGVEALFYRDTVVKFAEPMEGIVLITARDEYFEALSLYDKQVIVGTARENITEEEVLESLGKSKPGHLGWELVPASPLLVLPG